MKNWLQPLLAVCCILFSANTYAQPACSPTAVTKTNSTKVYVHYMPWFQGPINPTANGTGYNWGFHWTSDGSGGNPNTFSNVTDYTGATVSVRNIDAHFHPLIGPYDETDPYVVEYHLLLMKLSGIDGVMIDWYGLAGNGVGDAGINQNNTASIISKVGSYGLKYGLVIEDAGMSNGQANGNFAVNNYFPDPNYIKLGDMRGAGAANANAPLCAVFGPQQYRSQGQWNSILSGNTKAFLPLYGQAAQIGTDAGGTFLWPYPQAGQGIVNGVPSWYNDLNSYYNGSYYTGGAPNLHNNYREGGTTLGDNVILGSAYQGFFDFYMGNASSYNDPNANCGNCDQDGIIPRNYGPTGNTLATTLNLAQANKANIDGIQIATWNDFSEATIIEPTVEFGFQSLVTVQQFTGVSYTQTDLQEVYKLFQMRKQYTGNATIESDLDQVSCDFASNQVTAGETLLDCIASTGAACNTNSPAITSSTTYSAVANATVNYTITASKTPTSYGASGLPAGLSVNTSTGLISGTTQVIGTYSVTISATNSSGTGSATLTITITQPTTSSPYGGTAAIIPGTIQAENYDLGGQGVAYNDNDATNDGGQYRTTEGVDIETTEDVGGGYDIGWTNAGEWMQYTVNVEEAGVYTLQARVASIETGQTFTVTLDGVNISGTMTVPNTGGYQTWQTISVTTPFLTTGLHELRINETTGGYNFNYLTFINNTDEACSNANNILVADAGVAGNTYQWQVSTDNGTTYNNVSNSALYSGATTDVLTITNAPSGMYGYLYRCSINGSTAASLVTTLKFADTWTGAVNTAWEVGGNWSCGTVPDANSDVIINSGTAVINSTVTIRTLSLSAPAANLTVNTGQKLTVTH